ncbi:MAG: CehA/McbA family metallohydrolase [Pyrinomonadaceae bacterium]
MLIRVNIAIILILAAFSVIVPAQPNLKWYKGNTHTHTVNSDGDSTPDDVVKWYREHGYNFLFLTDHEYLTNPKPLNDLFGKEGSFLMIAGQEVTDSFDKKPYHSNALGISKVVMPNRLPGAVETLQKNINDIRAAGGIAQVNHPNFGWALTAEHLIKLQNYTLLEIHNGHPLVNNLGGGGSPGAEEIWDTVLSSGKVVYGVADDDSHYFKRIGDPTAPTPGQGWICVRATELTPTAIIDGMRTGNFYASTGVELGDYQADEKQITVTVKALPNSKYTVRFIGKNGRILAEVPTATAAYKIKGDEGYVRAKVLESNGKFAWTQPVFIGRK